MTESERLDRYLAGELSEADAAAFEAELERPECAAALGRTVQLIDALRPHVTQRRPAAGRRPRRLAAVAVGSSAIGTAAAVAVILGAFAVVISDEPAVDRPAEVAENGSVRNRAPAELAGVWHDLDESDTKAINDDGVAMEEAVAVSPPPLFDPPGLEQETHFPDWLTLAIDEPEPTLPEDVL